ncbi:unnamed protein product, partial [Mesorhabditis spiculigera]
MGTHETIHSGHFMTSNPHTDPTPDEEDDNEVDVEALDVDDDKPIDSRYKKISSFADKPVTFYKFGPRKTQSIAIDVSLNKLNKCIKVAYNKMTTPKWKDFKGLRLHWKQRIRLNNVIWRAYHMEFVKNSADGKPGKKQNKQKYCYFSVPEDDSTHAKVEVGTLIEGMYWKRRMEAVCAQYKRWRFFFQKRKPGQQQRRKRTAAEAPGVPQPAIKKSPPVQRSLTPKPNSISEWDADEFENIFTDELFATLNQPYIFPNPREMMQGGLADIMQPGLLSLQPSIEEIMNTDGCELLGPLNPTGGSAPPSAMGNDGMMMDQIHQGHMQFNQFLPPQLPMDRQLSTPADYSTKDYAAASMLVDYSNQNVPSQPTRMSSQINSPMMSAGQPQYSQAQYTTMPWNPVPSCSANGFLVTGGDVAQVDYSSPFAGHAGPSRLNQPGPAPSQSMGGMPWSRQTPSAPGWLEPQLPSPIPLQTPPPSMTSSSVLSPLQSMPPPHMPMQSGLRPLRGPALQPPPASRMSVPQHHQHQQMKRNRMDLAEPEPSKPSLLVSPITQQQQCLPRPPMHKQEIPTSPYGIPKQEPDWHPTMPQSPQGKVDWQQLMDAPDSAEQDDGLDMQDSKYEMTIATELEKNKMKEPPTANLAPTERKRLLHLHAEQSRRCALKDGFDQLADLIPDLYAPGNKPTNAVILAKAADYIRYLQKNTRQVQAKKATVAAKADALNNKITVLQSSLPTPNSVPTNSGSALAPQLMQFVNRYSRERSRENWDFALMVKMLEPMLQSLASYLHPDPQNLNEVSRSAAIWFHEEWKVQKLRQLLTRFLVEMSGKTSHSADSTALRAYALDLSR